MRVRGTFAHGFLCVITVMFSLGCTSQATTTETTPLRILLTNDDGYDAPGIVAVRKALIGAGHNVTVVAPLVNQSASSVRLTTRGLITYKEQRDGIWSVDGSPADAVLIGLSRVMRHDQPDLVVSGANFGQNLGYATSSGTVGAATMAMYRGLPAIAVSVGVDFAESTAKPDRFPSTLRAFDGAADFTVGLIRTLQETRQNGGGLLTSHTLLNVNYPAIEPEALQGVRVARAARSIGAMRLVYQDTGNPGELRAGFESAPPADNVDLRTDAHLFSLDFITITILDGDWDAGELALDSVSDRLSDMSWE